MSIPATGTLWQRFRTFLEQWGTVQETATGVQLSWGDHVTEVTLTPSQLHEYVADFVTWRTEHGMDDGLTSGLPLPLMDSFGETFGPQESAYARVELVGLGFQVKETRGS